MFQNTEPAGRKGRPQARHSHLLSNVIGPRGSLHPPCLRTARPKASVLWGRSGPQHAGIAFRANSCRGEAENFWGTWELLLRTERAALV